jgi:hypothetical protein
MNSDKQQVRVAVLAMAAVLLGASMAGAGPLVYEPFDMTVDDSVHGQAGGAGISGNWTRYDGDNLFVRSGSLSYGTLAVSGHRIVYDYSVGTGRTGMWASPGTTLSNAGLMDDGATLWFSYLLTWPSLGDTNDRILFSLGTDTTNAGGTQMNNSGNGIGISVDGSGTAARVQATTWSSGGRTQHGPTGTILPRDATWLFVGQIIWGTGGGDDTLNVYLPGTDLALPTVYSTGAANLDQSAFDTIAVSGKNHSPIIDEIRFGATYADVAPAIPEPASLALLTLGTAFALRRRRA